MAIAAGLGFVILLHTAPFSFLLDAFGGRSVWRVPQAPGERKVFLTFDDGPNPTATPELLDLLREQNVHATFFLIPDHVTEETAPIVRRMFAEGHGVGQHSADRWLMLRAPGNLAAEINRAAAYVERLTGSRPCPLFRPHGGWRSAFMLLGLGRVGHTLTGWSPFSWDWYWFRQRTGERVARQILGHASPGQIIVVHDGHHLDPRADRRYALDAARRIIKGMRERNFEFGDLCGA